jgi:hypothetical protein
MVVRLIGTLRLARAAKRFRGRKRAGREMPELATEALLLGAVRIRCTHARSSARLDSSGELSRRRRAQRRDLHCPIRRSGAAVSGTEAWGAGRVNVTTGVDRLRLSYFGSK